MFGQGRLRWESHGIVRWAAGRSSIRSGSGSRRLRLGGRRVGGSGVDCGVAGDGRRR